MKKIVINTRKLKVGVLAVLLILMATYGSGELLVRLVSPQILYNRYSPGHPEYLKEIVFDQYLGWALKKNYQQQTYSLQERYPRVTITHNSQGFRMDHEVDTSKEIIVMNGDSFMYGNSIDDKKIMSSRLNEFIGKNYEVINLGVKGYGTDQEYLRYLKEGAKYNPEIVVVLFFTNDFSNNMDYASYNRPKPVFRITVEGTLNLTNFPLKNPSEQISNETYHSFEKFMRSWSELYVLYKNNRRNVQSFFFGQEKESYFKVRREGDFWSIENNYRPIMNKSLIVTTKLLRRYHDEVTSRGGKFLLVLLPNKLDISPKMQQQLGNQFSDINELFFDHEKPYRLLENAAREAHIPVLDLYPLFKEELPKKDLYLIGNDHLNDYGHEVVAQEIYRVLTQWQWINST